MEASHEEMKAIMATNQENMNASQKRVEAMLGTAINAMQEPMDAEITSTHSEFEEPINNHVEDVLVLTDQWNHTFHEEVSTEIAEREMSLHKDINPGIQEHSTMLKQQRPWQKLHSVDSKQD
jgi:hypothetical protein